jgi:hypothetical protein
MNMRKENIELRAENAALRQDVQSLTEKVTLLLSQLSSRVIKKDSHNSSLPPSSDIGVSKTKSLRSPSELKSGGQLGHTGRTLKMS